MNTDGGLGLSSLEQQKQLAKVLAETKELMKQEEALIGKVLQGEEDLGKIRVSYLTQYNDEYSRLLNDVSKQSQALHRDFVALSKQLSENSKKINSIKSKETDTKVSEPKSKSNKKQSSSTTQNSSSKVTEDLTKAIRTLTTVVSDLRKATTSRYGTKFATTVSTKDKVKTGRSGSGGGPGDGTSTGTKGAEVEAVKVGSTLDDKTRASLKTPELEDILSIFNKKPQWVELEELAKIGLSEREKKLKSSTEELYVSINELELARLQLIKDNFLTEEQLRIKEHEEAVKLAEVRRSKLKEATDAELNLYDYLNTIRAELKHASTTTLRGPDDTGPEITEAGTQRARKVNAEAQLKAAQELETKRLKWIEKQELESRRRNGGILSKEESTRIQKQSAEKFKFDTANLKKLNEQRLKLEGAKAHAAGRVEIHNELTTMRKAGTFEERKQALHNLTHNETGAFSASKTLSAAITAISDLAKQLESKIDDIALYKGNIDTRLQGSNNTQHRGSYWGQLTRDMMSVGAITPFFKQEKFAENIKSLVDRGIAFDLKQRAFLMTIQEKIANTFNVADGTLLRLIRIQQEDSTAGRLGMESALNSFLNEMYENTEYLKDVAANVRSSLEEMEALMGGAVATEVEYQVQKWMGSLYSVGMSQSAVQGISTALGQIAAGQIDGLTSGSGAGNLLVMAANNSGKSISEILTEGLNAEETNKLLQATVNYLADIAESTKGNNVVQQQIAGVFGVKASDLRAATNLASAKAGQKNSIGDIFSETKSYNNMLNQLYNMAGSMAMRTSIGEMMSNVWKNAEYSIASSMSNSPIAYLTYKLASLLDSAVGGIDLPFVNVMGFGVDLNTTVSDLMRVAAIGGGLLSNLGPMISGLSSSFNGRGMLSTMGIKSGSGLAITPRGGDGISALDNNGSALSTSGSGYVGNASSSDVKNATLQEAEDSKKKQMIEAKEEEPTNQVDVLNTYVLKIYEMLDEVVSGDKSFRVRVDSYGLIGGLKSSSGGAQGGIGGLLNNNTSGIPGSSFESTNNTSDLNSSKLSSDSTLGATVDLGGWTTL